MRLHPMLATRASLGGVARPPLREQVLPSRPVRYFYDASNDAEVCCTQCGVPLSKYSDFWWDDYTCTRCHERR